jgi:biopolymer transport protein ExbD
MARSFIAPASETGFEPIATINTTPLIDMMLVLLIMFIVAVPVATHKVPLDLPVGASPPNQPAVHRLDVAADGTLDWDGAPVSMTAMRRRLAAMAADPADPELQLRVAAEARYERVDAILTDIRRAGIGRLGFVGNERFAPALDR